MGLVLYDPAARFGVAVHDQMPQLVRHIEPLPVIIALNRVQDHDGTQAAVERVRVHGRGAERTEDYEHAVVF